MNKNSFEALLKTSSNNPQDLKDSINWLKTFTRTDAIEFGLPYKINYLYKSTTLPYKIIIPLSQEKDNLICFELLDMQPFVRARLFDIITNDSSIIKIDNNMFKFLGRFFLLKQSVKRILVSQIKDAEKITFEGLKLVLNLPIIRAV